MIVLKNICKSLQGKQILNNISFHIAKNETVGIIGRNGAGKTTLLHVIAGMLEPEEGFLRVGQAEVLIEDREMLKNVAFVSGDRQQLWEDIHIQDSLAHCVRMYGVTKEEAEQRFQQLDQVFQIQPFLESFPQKLSLGERIRCELVYALLSAPKLLLLDEAVIGLDVSIKYNIMEYFEEIKKTQEMTILYTSHNFGEIEKLCDRILLVEEGSILFDGTIQQMMQVFSPLYYMELVIGDSIPDFEDLPVEKFMFTNHKLRIVYDKQKIDTAQILAHILAQTKVWDVKLFEPNLEDMIRQINEHDLFYDGE